MRKEALILICMLALAYCLFPQAATLTANADEEYEWVRVTEEGVFLYANNYSSKVLCILQKSYYLRVVSRESEMLLVSIMGDNAYFPAIVGYVWARSKTSKRHRLRHITLRKRLPSVPTARQ